ncbi:MAG: hypothetical protein ACR2IE_04260 [Candidatus Sumerlaeaceae bacterium]
MQACIINLMILPVETLPEPLVFETTKSVNLTWAGHSGQATIAPGRTTRLIFPPSRQVAPRV